MTDVKPPQKPYKTPLQRDDESSGLSLAELIETSTKPPGDTPEDWIVRVDGCRDTCFVIVPYDDENGVFRFFLPDKSKAVRCTQLNAITMARNLADTLKDVKPLGVTLVFTAIEDKK